MDPLPVVVLLPEFFNASGCLDGNCTNRIQLFDKGADTLMLVLPYHPAESAIPTPDGFDGTYHPERLENTPRRYAIVRANQIMVDTCDWLVCYVCHGASNSRNLLEYARRREENGLI